MDVEKDLPKLSSPNPITKTPQFPDFYTNGGFFNWRPLNSTEVHGLLVSVRAESNAHLTLTPSTSTNDSNIEIIFGADGNRKSIIREDNEDCEAACCTHFQRNIINGEEFRTFSITWQIDKQNVVFVTDDSTRCPLLQITRANKFDIAFFGVRTS